MHGNWLPVYDAAVAFIVKSGGVCACTRTTSLFLCWLGSDGGFGLLCVLASSGQLQRDGTASAAALGGSNIADRQEAGMYSVLQTCCFSST
jgi:hypothetical protein